MPQITVTLDEDVYMDMIHNLPKGLKSKFVNRAVVQAIKACATNGKLMHIYARKGPQAMNHAWLDAIEAAKHPNQTTLGVEEE